jgi:hypothetical protein
VDEERGESSMNGVSHTTWFRNVIPALRLSLTALVVSACASQGVQQASQTPEQRLVERVRQYWEARVRDDIVEQYRFEEPTIREQVSLTAFARGKGATKILAYEVKGVEVKDSGAVAKVHLRYRILVSRLAHLPPKEVDLDQAWVWVEDNWYLRYQSAVGGQ